MKLDAGFLTYQNTKYVDTFCVLRTIPTTSTIPTFGKRKKIENHKTSFYHSVRLCTNLPTQIFDTKNQMFHEMTTKFHNFQFKSHGLMDQAPVSGPAGPGSIPCREFWIFFVEF